MKVFHRGNEIGVTSGSHVVEHHNLDSFIIQLMFFAITRQFDVQKCFFIINKHFLKYSKCLIVRSSDKFVKNWLFKEDK